MLFFPGGVVKLLRALGFSRLSNGVMRILTDQLNGHIKKVATKKDIPIHWWPSEGGATDGAKLTFVHNKYAKYYTGTEDHVFCILTNKEPVRTFVCRDHYQQPQVVGASKTCTLFAGIFVEWGWMQRPIFELLCRC